MITYFFSPPGLYYLIAFIIIVSLLVYWKREPIKREIRQWRAKEVTAGPLKLERQTDQESLSKTGVSLGDGGNFSGAKISGIAGRDIIRGSKPSTQDEGSTPGVNLGSGDFRKTEVSDVAGRDIIEIDGSSTKSDTDKKD